MMLRLLNFRHEPSLGIGRELFMENGLFCCFEDKMLSLCFLLVFFFFDHSKVGRDYEEEHRVHILILHSYLFILITEALPGQRSYSFSNGISC